VTSCLLSHRFLSLKKEKIFMHHRRMVFLLLFVTLVWGATFTLTKSALPYISPFAFLTVRFYMAAVLLTFPVVLQKSARASLTLRNAVVGLCVGVVLYLGYAFQTFGLETTSAATSAFLTGLSVVLVPMLSLLLRRAKKPGMRLWGGSLFALLGLFLLCGTQLLGLRVGVWYGLACALFMALQVLLIDRFSPDIHPLTLAWLEICVMALLFFLSTEVTSGNHTWSTIPFSQPQVMIALLVNGVLATAFAYSIQNIGQRAMAASQIAIIFTMEPVFAAVLSWWWADQRMSLDAMLGAAFILLGMWFSDSSIPLKYPRKNNYS
jgi:drug/metabolite transporter (DMT)-like permease